MPGLDDLWSYAWNQAGEALEIDQIRAEGMARIAAASRVWEERFGEQVYGPLAEAATTGASAVAGSV